MTVEESMSGVANGVYAPRYQHADIVCVNIYPQHPLQPPLKHARSLRTIVIIGREADARLMFSLPPLTSVKKPF